MHHLTCHCRVKYDKIQGAIDHTLAWIPKLQEQYDEPIIYEAFQDVENPHVFTYFITHSTPEDECKVANMEEPRKFGEKLYKMCISEPKWIEHNRVNSISRSKTDSKIYSRVEYKVKQDKIKDVKLAIRNYIDIVRETEPSINVYESYQNKGEPSKFIHLAQFKDKEIEENHKNKDHTQEFSNFLYPLCEIEPQFSYMNLIGSVRR